MDDSARRALLKLARETLQAHLEGRPPPEPVDPVPEAAFGGLFVTLHRAGRLRGCIGQFRAGRGPAGAVREMAVAAAHDPRFASNPVTARELPEIDIEISVLSEPQPVKDPLALVPGVHGIIVRRGTRSGCFLPQVATEQGWNMEQMLNHCCEGKAGLPPDAWRQPGTEVLAFTAEVFGERTA